MATVGLAVLVCGFGKGLARALPFAIQAMFDAVVVLDVGARFAGEKIADLVSVFLAVLERALGGFRTAFIPFGPRAMPATIGIAAFPGLLAVVVIADFETVANRLAATVFVDFALDHHFAVAILFDDLFDLAGRSRGACRAATGGMCCRGAA